MSGYIQSNQPVQLVAAAGAATMTLTAADSGKLFFIPVLNNTLGITLPALQAGLRFRFTAQGILAAIVTITPNTAANIFVGSLLVNNANTANVVPKTGAANVQLTATAASGDFVELICDGTLWHAFGSSRVAAGLA